MRKVLHLLNKIWILNFFRRIYNATKYYNKRYCQILRWGFRSREESNYTYHLSSGNIRYLASTLSAVTGADPDTVLTYINEAENDSALKQAIIEATDKSKLRGHADREVRFGRRLGWYALVRIMKPGIVVETGVDKGLGSMLLCSALLRNKEEGHPGKYYGTDINPKAGYLLSGKYKETGEILYGDSIESLSAMKESIDLFINDSDHSAEYEYREYQTIQKLLNENSIILGDNSHCSDKLALFSREQNRDFLYFAEQPRDHWYPGGGIGISFSRQKNRQFMAHG